MKKKASHRVTGGLGREKLAGVAWASVDQSTLSVEIASGGELSWRPSHHQSHWERRMESHNAKLGVGLFVVYLTLYGGFVGINALLPSMEATPIAGLNLAVLYGVGLIFFAFVLVLYGFPLQGRPRHARRHE
ncbi:MAG: hypothetical protein R3B96_04305 [Pirellulaceae bacterium]